MDTNFRVNDKCRKCLAPNIKLTFARVVGTIAYMFTYVFGDLVAADGGDVICQKCTDILATSYSNKSQEDLADQQRNKVTPQGSDSVPKIKVKEEPPVEFVLILPRPGWQWHTPIKEEDIKMELADEPAVPQQPQDPLTCQHCHFVVTRKSSLTNHLRACTMLHPRGIQCDICGLEVNSKDRMKSHMYRHKEERNVTCDECGFTFKSERHLKLHLSTHKKRFDCETCYKKFAYPNNLKDHQMHNKHGAYTTSKKSFDCDKCFKHFSTAKSLKSHHITVHDEQRAKCEDCNKICKNRRALYQHMKTHVIDQCSFCQKMISKKALPAHERRHALRFNCDLCAFFSTDKRAIIHHIKGQHLKKFSQR